MSVSTERRAKIADEGNRQRIDGSNAHRHWRGRGVELTSTRRPRSLMDSAATGYTSSTDPSPRPGTHLVWVAYLETGKHVSNTSGHSNSADEAKQYVLHGGLKRTADAGRMRPRVVGRCNTDAQIVIDIRYHRLRSSTVRVIPFRIAFRHSGVAICYKIATINRGRRSIITT